MKKYCHIHRITLNDKPHYYISKKKSPEKCKGLAVTIKCISIHIDITQARIELKTLKS